tara:strand:- start:41808 stop:42995 length:1188 start_codon:yes stop_codon:yes gene_type:complete
MQDIPVYLNHLGIVCSLGRGAEQVWQTLQQPDAEPLTLADEWMSTPVYVGQVKAELPPLAQFAAERQSRNNQLLMSAWQQLQVAFAAMRQGIAAERIGIVLGSSTSGIAEAFSTVQGWVNHQQPATATRYAIQEMSAPALSLADWSGAKGPTYVVSTACSSGAKALASARRLIQQDVCDLVIAGGVDSLAAMTLNGFGALESLATAVCAPFSAHRDGINIGEGAALFIMSKEPAAVALAGVGESSDAHHISAPHPQGAGAIAAMSQALQQRQLNPEQVSYINLHGTATEQNDRMESQAVFRLFGDRVAASSTKALTGHTLGAAGAIEAAFCWLTMQQDGRLPPHRWDGVPDPALAPLRLVTAGLKLDHPPVFTLSNSFAFGGNNISLLFERIYGD